MKGWFAAARAKPFMASVLEVVENLGEDDARRLALDAVRDQKAAGSDLMDWVANRTRTSGLRKPNSPIVIEDLMDYQVIALWALIANALISDVAPALAVLAAREYGKHLASVEHNEIYRTEILPAIKDNHRMAKGRAKGKDNSVLSRQVKTLQQSFKAFEFIESKFALGLVPSADAVADESGVPLRTAATMLRRYRKALKSEPLGPN